MPEREPLYYADDDKKDTLYKTYYIDSMYGLRMLLRKDGRKRGLWVWLENEVHSRNDTDHRQFDRGMKELVPELQKIFAKKDQKMLEYEVRNALRMHLDFFFGHRNEGMAIRLPWKDVLKFADKLKAGHAAEKHKTEDD